MERVYAVVKIAHTHTHTHFFAVFAVGNRSPDRCETQDSTPFPSPSPQEKDFVCALSQTRLSCFLWGWACVRLCFIRDCEVLSHSHLKRAFWGAMGNVPCVIFILNTTYSLPDFPLFVSFYSPSPFVSISFLSPFFSITPTHLLTAWEIPLFISQWKKKNEAMVAYRAGIYFLFFCPGMLFSPNTQFFVLEYGQRKLWNAEPVDGLNICSSVLTCVC